MQYYEYHLKSPVTLQKAREKYAWLFSGGLSDESIEVRYYLLKYLQQVHGYTGKIEKEHTGKPIPIITTKGTTLYWSISHSENYIAFIVSDAPTGIDIAEYRERDISLLDTHTDSEYDIQGGKDWENFYILWTAKESIIKSIGGQLDNMKNIICVDKQQDNISLFAFQHEKYRIQTLLTDSIILSYTL